MEFVRHGRSHHVTVMTGFYPTAIAVLDKLKCHVSKKTAYEFMHTLSLSLSLSLSLLSLPLSLPPSLSSSSGRSLRGISAQRCTVSVSEHRRQVSSTLIVRRMLFRIDSKVLCTISTCSYMYMFILTPSHPPSSNPLLAALGDVSEASLLRDVLFVFQNIDGKFIHFDSKEDAFRIDSKVHCTI